MATINTAMVLYTNGIEYDDRIRKEIVTIQKNCPRVKFKIFAFVADNHSEIGVSEYGVPYELISLRSRSFFASGRYKLIKAYEFYARIRKKLKEYDIVWCADIHVFLFPLLLSRKTKIIWDLHEIPNIFLGSKLKSKIFHYLEDKCILFYHANSERVKFLTEEGLIRLPEKHFVIRNYPDKPKIESANSEQPKIYLDFISWLGNARCVYLQGIYEQGRRSYQSMAAIMAIDGLKAVVVGRPDKKAVRELICTNGEARVNSKLFFTGMIPQKYTHFFINKCQLSLIFYSVFNPNNKYCEPNRLFQTVLSGLPVVVGCNPPMKEFVERLGAGVVLNSDGNDINEIISAVKEILIHLNTYKDNINSNKSQMYWNCQEKLIINSFTKFLNI